MQRASVFVALIVAVLVGPFVRAADEPLSDAHLNVIRTNCIDAQPTFYRIQQSDKTARINRGYNYEMTLRLMTAFNSRAALNRVDSSSLLTLTSEYEKELKEFTTLYTQYDENLSRLAEYKCREQPTEFYTLLQSTRAQRVSLNGHINEMERLLGEYQKSLDAVKESAGVARR